MIHLNDFIRANHDISKIHSCSWKDYGCYELLNAFPSFLIIYQMVSYGMRQWILIKKIFLYVPPQKSEILTLPYIYLNDFFGQTMADSNLNFVFWLNGIDISGTNQCFAYHFHFSWIRKCSNLFDSLSICSIS